MKFDPKDTERYREQTAKQMPMYLRARLCVSCKRVRSVGQFNSDKSVICNKCKGK